jgi:hypothetical protein
LKLPFLAMLDRLTVPERLKRTEFWSGLDRAVFGEPYGCGVWLDVVNAHNTQAVCYAFGQWLGERFRDYSNLVWLDGNDFDGNRPGRAGRYQRHPAQPSGHARDAGSGRHTTAQRRLDAGNRFDRSNRRKPR